MPKARGMTSLEIAVIVAIVLIIAVAVGWYIYTTFVASAVGQPRLTIISADIFKNGTIVIRVFNPGPVDVTVANVEIAGRLYSAVNTINVGKNATISVNIGTVDLAAGTMVPGRVILSGGQSFPFNAIVRP